ncbi:MAG: ion channel, partial [Cyanobacteria bacterium P01_F01_bin.143]
SNLTDNLSWWQKIIPIIYFNNTTMLTVGYGDIYPTDSLTKIVVLFQQTFGFAITGSFLTLLLRKLFRF